MASGSSASAVSLQSASTQSRSSTPPGERSRRRGSAGRSSTTARAGGSGFGWTTRKLPLPYVIDPAANYPTPLELRNSATGVTGSWDLDSGTGTVDITTNNTPASAAVGWYAWDPALSVTAQQTTLPTTTDGKGWLVDPAGGATGFPAGTWTFTVQTDIPNATLVAGTAVLTVGVFKGTISGGVFTPTGTILTPTDDPLAQDLRSAVTPVTTTVSYTLPKFSLAAGETLFVDYWRHQTGGITAPQAARRQLDFHVNDGVAQIAHPVADDTGPTHTSFTVAEGTNPSRQYFDGTSTVYYSPATAGDFVVTDAITRLGLGPVLGGLPRGQPRLGRLHPLRQDGHGRPLHLEHLRVDDLEHDRTRRTDDHRGRSGRSSRRRRP